MNVKLLTEQNLEFLRLKGGSSESTLVKMPHCWKSHVAVQLFFQQLPKMFGEATWVNECNKAIFIILKAEFSLFWFN